MTPNIDTLRRQRGAKHDELKAIHAACEKDNRGRNEAETKKWDEIKGEIAVLDQRIQDAELIEGNEARSSRPVDRPARFEMPKFYPAHRLKAFRHGTNEERTEAAYRSGMFLAATLYKMPGAIAWCKEHGIALTPAQWGEDKALSGTSNVAGGFLVPSEFEASIIDLRETYGVSRQLARVMPMARDSMDMPRRTGGLTAYAVSDNVEITASDKSWDNVSLNARKWGVLCKYSSELAEDAVINLADDLAQEIAYAFAEKEDDCFFNGDGGTTYHGIVGIRTKIINGSYTASAKDAASGHDTFAEYDASDLATVMAALPQYALGNAKWICSQVAFSLVFERLAQAAGGLTKAETGAATPYRYQGYPVMISQKMPTSTADISDTVAMLFGDMSKSTLIGDRRGVAIATSADRFFEYDQLAIRGTTRSDIVHHSLGSTTAAGPVIALVAE